MRGHPELSKAFGRKYRVLRTLGLDSQSATVQAEAHARKMFDQRQDIQDEIEEMRKAT